MVKYKRYSLALNEEEEKKFRSTGMGVKKIFKAMLDALCPEYQCPEKKDAIIEDEI